MKIRNQHIAALVKRLKRPRNALRSPQIMHPMREWVLGIVVAVVLFAVTATWGAATYLAHRDVSVLEQGENQITETAYRAAQVEQALSEFADRAVEHAALLETTPTTFVVEPTPIATSTATTTPDTAREEGVATSTEVFETDDVDVSVLEAVF